MKLSRVWMVVVATGCVGDEAQLRGPECPSGQTQCDGSCIDTAFHPAHCGSCNNGCPEGQVCSLGACGDDCTGGTLRCGARCVDSMIDPNNCGDCGIVCTEGIACSGGMCGTCETGTTPCSGVCVDTNTDLAHCGACDTPCAQTCKMGMCADFTSCATIKASLPTAPDGVYSIDPNAGSDDDVVQVFCDMTTDGGGWTAVAANGDLADETTDPNDCYPLITNDPMRGCGDPADLMQDYTLRGSQQAALSWRYLMAIVYGDSGYADKLAYFAIDFGTALPTSEARDAGTPYDPSGLTTPHGIVACAPSHIVHYEKAGLHNPYAGVANDKGTVFGHDSGGSMASSNRQTFGFTDTTAHATGQVKGVDDYQDGWSCGDAWVPQAVRGQRMVVLVK